MTEKIKMMAFL